eukprot:SAG31_NODE_15177_length_766_cov_3.599700_1_plen_130_part_00
MGRAIAYGRRRSGPDGRVKWQPFDPEIKMQSAAVTCFLYEDTPMFKYVGTPLQADTGSKLLNEKWVVGISEMIQKVEGAGLTPQQTVHALSMWLRATQAWEMMTVDPPDSLVAKAQAAVQAVKQREVCV